METKHETPVLQVEHLDIKFNLRGKVLHAIRDVSLELYEGETLAIVGESGSGKSVLTKAFMGLNDQSGWIDHGSILYQGHDLARYRTEKEWLTIRGREIAMVLQDPMTSLNPLKTIGAQIEEALRLHQGLRGEAARQKTVELLTDVGITEPERRRRRRHSLPSVITAASPSLRVQSSAETAAQNSGKAFSKTITVSEVSEIRE